MESTHFIRDFNVDISFPSETEAFGEHSVLDSFVSQRLVAVADEVFNAAMQSSALVLNIDALEIDLGELPARGFYAEAESRFRKRLAEPSIRCSATMARMAWSLLPSAKTGPATWATA